MASKNEATAADPAAPTAERDVGGPRSLTRLLALFGQLSQKPEGLSLAELSVSLESPKSSLLNLLRPLVAEGYLIHSSGSYRLGPSIFRLSASVISAWGFPKLIRPLMEELVTRTRETAMLGVPNSQAGEVTFAEVVDSPQPVRLQVPVGVTRPLHISPSGWVLLAQLEPATCEAYIDGLAIETPTVPVATPITRASLANEIEKIRRDGVGISLDAVTSGVGSVVAPVFNADGQCVATLGIAGPSGRIRQDLDSIRAAVIETAAKASAVMADRSPARSARTA